MGFCKRHPERAAGRRCYQCKDEVCAECQIHLDRHIFCSHRCHLDWQAAERRTLRRKRIEAGLNAFNPLIWWRYPAFRRTAWAKRSMVMIWLLLATNVVLVASIFVVFDKLRAVQQELATLSEPDRMWPSTWISEPEETEGYAHMRVAAPSADTVVLKNGRAVAQVAAGTATSITLRSDSIAPSVWQLASRESKHGEKWTVSQPELKDVRRGSRRPGVALTFDGGADRNAVDSILATLQRHQVRATFFLTGEFIARFPDDVRRIVSYGHEIGNHTWSHLHLTTFEQNRRHNTLPEVDKRRLQHELLTTSHIFARVTGLMMAPYWRAPFGETNDDINAWAGELGFQHIGWTTHGRQTMDTLDWVANPDDPLFISGQAMAKRIADLARQPAFRGGIVLMHVGTQRRVEQVHAHLPEMIAGIAAAGIPFFTVSDLTDERGS